MTTRLRTSNLEPDSNYEDEGVVELSVEEKYAEVKQLIVIGKEKGFLTYAEVSDHLPEVVDSEQIDDVISMIQTMGIQVHDEAPDEESQLFSEPAVVASAEEEEDAAEEAAAALAASDDQFGRTTDPVRMYMREMGSVELLDREGEIRIAKRIEEGLNEALYAMAIYPETVKILLDAYDSVGEGKRRLAEVITGFFDPNAEPVSEVPPVVELAEEEDDEEEDEEDTAREERSARSDDLDVREHAEARGFSWAYWELASPSFGMYSPQTGWHEPIRRALHRLLRPFRREVAAVHRLLQHRLRERVHDVQVHIGFQQRRADIRHRVGDVVDCTAARRALRDLNARKLVPHRGHEQEHHAAEQEVDEGDERDLEVERPLATCSTGIRYGYACHGSSSLR